MIPSSLAETYGRFGGTSQDSTLQDGSSRFFYLSDSLTNCIIHRTQRIIRSVRRFAR